MGRLVCDIAVSADGYVAGPNQSEERPFGDGPVEELHAWLFEDEENAPVLDQIVGASAYLMGRNMFGPVRGGWDRDWRGWWGEDPPHHAPVSVLTHHPRDPLPMQGGTTFTFVTEGIESALAQARAAAGDRDMAIDGVAATVNQFLAAGLVDELRLHLAPVVLGAGERLFAGVPARRLEQTSAQPARRDTHLTYRPAS